MSRFVVSAAHTPLIFFVSSKGSTLSLLDGSTAVSETQSHSDTRTLSTKGYGENECVADDLLDHASSRLPIKAWIVRMWHIAGPSEGQGVWNECIWLPSLIFIPRHVDIVPISLGASQSKID